jgi:RAT1-interacting protein
VKIKSYLIAMELSPYNIGEYNNPFPKFSQPDIVGAFSVDSCRNYRDDMKNIKYLKIPKTNKINFNLNEGDEKYVEKLARAKDEKLDHLIKFIMGNYESAMQLNSRPNFVCFRGLLRLIMTTPFELRENWIILATKVKGVIYLVAEETAQKRAKIARQTSQDKKFQRYGFKFESHIFANSPQENPQPDEVNENLEFAVMFKAKIDNTTLLYCAEIDGVISDREIANLNDLKSVPLVEAKVKRKETNHKQLLNFHKFKTKNWWCQSFLVNISTVHVGLRDDHGYVHEIVPMSLKEMYEATKSHENSWKANICMNFLNSFLKKVQYDMRDIDDDPFIILKYEWNEMKHNFVVANRINDRKFAFLSKDFIDFLNNRNE